MRRVFAASGCIILWKGGRILVVYLDLIFLLNCMADAMALYITARLTDLPLRLPRVIAASLLGGIYGVVCALPVPVNMRSFFVQSMIAGGLIWLVFGMRKIFLRLFSLFFVLSCAIGGVMLALSQYVSAYGIGDALQAMDWKVFFLVGGLCYFLLSVVFRGSAHHAVAGEILAGKIMRDGRSVSLNILHDTGHTLSDPVTGAPVLTVWKDALAPLWTTAETEFFSSMDHSDAPTCFMELSTITPGYFRLIPYRAVGISEGFLLCFRPDQVIIDRKDLGPLCIAVSPTPISGGGGYTALWGGGTERGKSKYV